MIDKIKNFGYNLVNDNQTKALVASIVINIILIICLLSIMITGKVPGKSYDEPDTDDTLITECTLEHVDPSASTTTTTETTTTTTTQKVYYDRTTARQQTTTTANRDNDGEWVEGWY